MTAAGPPESRAHPPVRSFVMRAGRITRAQRRAIDELLPRFGLPPPPAALDLDAAFGRRAPRIMEIGYGDGATLLELAARSPETDFIGVEVHTPGIGHCLLGIESRGLRNLRVIAHDAVEVLASQFGAGSLDGVLLYFPDPWPKKRHHKRRIVQPQFVAQVASRLKTGGAFRLATDWEPYAAWMLEVLDAEPLLANASPDGRFIDAAERASTRFEARGRRLGHEVFDICFRRV